MDASDPRPLAYSYIRMSTDIQLRGDSLRRQTQASEKYAEQNGLQLVAEFKLEDIGVSAFKGDNITFGALGRFLLLVQSRVVPRGSYLLVESLDRISRQQVLDSVPLFFDIVKAGINVVTLADNHIYKAGHTSLADILYSIVVLSRAHEESNIKSQRVGAAWGNKRRNAGRQKLTRVAPAWLTLRATRDAFEVISERVDVVRQMFEMADVGHGSFVIARHLNQSGTPTFAKSNGWHESYVTKILNSRAVLGEFQPHRYSDGGKRVPDGDPISDYFPKIIEEDQFFRVQAARRKRLIEGAGRKGPEYRNLFSKIAKCGYCGSPMRFVHKGLPPKGGQFLKCTNAVRNLGCESRSWAYTAFETSFLYFVKEIDLTSTLEAAAKMSGRAVLEQQISAHEEKRRQLQEKREKIFEMLVEPGVSSSFVKSKLEDCEAEIAAQTTFLEGLQVQRSGSNEEPTISAAELQSLIAGIQDMSAPDIFDRRATVANRLRNIVTDLRLEVEGQKPKRAARVAILDQIDDPDERARILAAIDRSDIEGQRYNRTFSVTLADGTSRRVIVKNDDPTDFVAEVLVDGAGSVAGSEHGIAFDRLFPIKILE